MGTIGAILTLNDDADIIQVALMNAYAVEYAYFEYPGLHVDFTMSLLPATILYSILPVTIVVLMIMATQSEEGIMGKGLA